MNPAEDDEARLRNEAERRDVSAPRHLLSAGAGHSGRSDVSERIDEILAAELGESG